jgi:hypothetical protein
MAQTPNETAEFHVCRTDAMTNYGLQEEHAKVAIAAFGDTPENRSITCGDLLGDQTQPSSKISV